MDPTHFRPVPTGPRSRRRGIALILVLACVVLLTVMILAYLASIGTEVRSSKFYVNGGSVKLLAQSTGDLVTAEIRDATANGALCWASQPGMIRTYDNTGAAHSYYKLYSDATMTGTGAFDYTTATISGTWASQAGVYVDLNQPVPIVSGTATTYVYPIVDGSSSDVIPFTPTGTVTASTVGIPTGASIIGPQLTTGPYSGYPQVTGFGISNAPGVTSSSINQVPMPVRWLYVLKNGSIAVPNSSTTGTVTFMTKDPVNTSNVLPVPTATNPIVGRIAFWTDDETSKVNVNTAGESDSVLSVNATGTSVSISTGSVHSAVWDIPRANISSEINLSRYLPAQNEFQRYPGHPATVCLSTVFGNLSTDANFAENIYPLTPRLTASTSTPYTPGTSTAGYWAGGQAYSYVGTGSDEGVQVPNVALNLTFNHLYADADEFLYSKARTLNSSELSQSTIKQSEFFVTATSRAPDVNLFNQPRVCIWPLSSTTTSWTPNDQLIAFCTTVSGSIYYIQRSNANDPGVDLPATATATGVGRNRSVLEYLRYLTKQKIPGFGGALGGSNGKYGGAAANAGSAATGATGKDAFSGDGITTNLDGSTTYESDQILTEMFDYIRSTNLYDASTATAVPFTSRSASTTGQYTVSGTNSAYNPGLGQVVPIVDQNGTRGFGRFPTVHSVTMDFFPLQNTFVPVKSGTTYIYTREVSQMQAVLALQMFDPSMGFPQNIPWYQIKVTLTGFKWADGTNMFPNSPGLIGNPYGGNFNAGSGNAIADRQIGGMYDFRRMLISCYSGYQSGSSGSKFSDWNPNAASTGTAYSYGSLPFTPTGTTTSPNGGGLFSSAYPSTPKTSSYTTASPAPNGTAAILLPNPGSFTGGTVEIQIFNNNSTGAAASTTPLQDISFNFGSDSNLPLPSCSNNIATISGSFGIVASVDHGPSNGTNNSTPPTSPSPTNWASDTTLSEGWQLWTNRFASLPDQTSTYAIDFIGDGDVTRSMMQANQGDVRLLAARQLISTTTGTSFFSAHPAFGSGVRVAHDLQDGLNRVAGAFVGPCYGTSLVNPAGSGSGGTGGALVPLSLLSPNYYYGLFGTTYISGGDYAEYTGYGASNQGSLWSDVPTQSGVFVGMPGGGVSTVPGDWDNGMANYKDGAYINKADEGSTQHSYNINGGYFDPVNQINPGTTCFSPNREIPSAGMFGSLPTGVLENIPWRTLLFRPGPAGHPGLGYSLSGTTTSAAYAPPYSTPPDSLFMDLFTMPVVEPYAISEPLSTAGRVNMNYQIIPFTYITRNTAVQAALRSVSVVAIPNTDGSIYKHNYYSNSPTQHGPYRVGLNMPATLSQFDARMTTNKDLFRSAAEICSIDLVPSIFATPSDTPGTAAWRSDIDTDWNSYALTGDNTRERPYANLYPLLTTKSNTFTVHYRVQTLQPAAGISGYNVAQWREGTDVITGEYRGSQTIERYVDPGDSTIPDFTTTSTGTLTGTQTLAPYYKFRVLANKQFAP